MLSHRVEVSILPNATKAASRLRRELLLAAHIKEALISHAIGDVICLVSPERLLFAILLMSQGSPCPRR